MNLRVGKLRQTSGRLHSHGPRDWRRFFRCGGGGFLLMGIGKSQKMKMRVGPRPLKYHRPQGGGS